MKAFASIGIFGLLASFMGAMTLFDRFVPNTRLNTAIWIGAMIVFGIMIVACVGTQRSKSSITSL